jgi:hypothetical protein
LFPPQSTLIFISITFILCLGVYLHFHHVQMRILWFLFGLCYLCSMISILLFVLLCLHFVICVCCFVRVLHVIL